MPKPPVIKPVDGRELRAKGDKWGDFADFGTNYSFNEIPKGELWIDNNLSKEDLESALIQGLAELQMYSSYDRDEIIDNERLIDLFIRRHDMQNKDINVYVSEYHPRFVDTHGVKVYLVDGDAVRDLVSELLKTLPKGDAFSQKYTEWIEGGNGWKYPFIPKDEYWIDSKLSPNEIEKTILHEHVESIYMSQGMPYDQAHALATKAEYEFEDRMKKLEAVRKGIMHGIR